MSPFTANWLRPQGVRFSVGCWSEVAEKSPSSFFLVSLFSVFAVLFFKDRARRYRSSPACPSSSGRQKSSLHFQVSGRWMQWHGAVPPSIHPTLVLRGRRLVVIEPSILLAFSPRAHPPRHRSSLASPRHVSGWAPAKPHGGGACTAPEKNPHLVGRPPAQR